MVSGLSEADTKVRCLGLGAADFVAKPFSVRDLVERIQARVHTAAGPGGRMISAGPISLDLARKVVDVGRGAVSLAGDEFALLQRLMARPGRVCSRDRLLEDVWGSPHEGRGDLLDGCVERLRSKLGHEMIETVWSTGYRIDLTVREEGRVSAKTAVRRVAPVVVLLVLTALLSLGATDALARTFGAAASRPPPDSEPCPSLDTGPESLTRNRARRRRRTRARRPDAGPESLDPRRTRVHHRTRALPSPDPSPSPTSDLCPSARPWPARPPSLSPTPYPDPSPGPDVSPSPTTGTHGGSTGDLYRGTYSTERLVAAADVLRQEGWSEEEIRRQVFSPFIVVGAASWSDSWGAPRFGPGSIVRRHEGQDVLCAYGAEVLAAEDGTIEFGTSLLGGRDARLHRPGGGFWYYAHLSEWNLDDFSNGDRVHTGDVIGYCGESGNATVPHVHFGHYGPDGEAIDPMGSLVSWLREAESDLGDLFGDTPVPVPQATLPPSMPIDTPISLVSLGGGTRWTHRV